MVEKLMLIANQVIALILGLSIGLAFYTGWNLMWILTGVAGIALVIVNLVYYHNTRDFDFSDDEDEDELFSFDDEDIII